MPDLAVPPEWAPRGRNLLVRLGVVLLAMLTLGALARAVALATGGELATASGVAYAAVLLGHVVALSWQLGRKRSVSRPHPAPPVPGTTDLGEPGVCFRHSAAGRYLLSAVLLIGAVGSIGIALGILSSGDGGGTGLSVVMLTCGVVLLGFVVVTLGGGTRRVVLAEKCLYHRGLTFTHALPWDSIADVAPQYLDRVPAIVVKAVPSPQARTRVMR